MADIPEATLQSTRDRRHMVAILCAAGMRTSDIAAETGYNANRISTLRNSPLFVRHVESLKAKIRDGSINDVMALIEREAGASVRTLIEIRDRDDVETAQRRGAANDILDRTTHFSRKSKLEEDRTFRLVFSPSDVAQMQLVAIGPATGERASDLPADDRVIDMAEPAPAPRHVLRTLDEAIAAAEQEPA